MRLHTALLLTLALAPCAAIVHAQNTPLPPGTAAPPDAPASTSTAKAGPQPGPLNIAEEKLDARDYAGARAVLLPYLSAHPGDARALFDLGYAEDAAGDTAAAEAGYRKAIAADPKQFEAQAALGLLLANQGRRTDAVTALQAAALLTPAPPDPAAQAQGNRTLARLLEPSDPAAARRALIAALQQSPETPPDTLLAAELAAAAGDTDAAADAYGKVLAATPAGSPAQAEAAAGLAHLLIAAKRYPEAEPVLRKALASNPQSPALNSELAEVLSAEGKPEDSIAVLETLHAGHPDDSAISTMLADLYTQTGDLDKADTLYQQLLATHPHDATLLAAHGDALVRGKHFAEAIPVLQEATRLNPSDGNAWSGLAFAASQAGQPQLVLDALAMRSKVMSETPATYFLAATACDSLHATKRAVELYRQFLSVAGSGFPDETWQAKHRLIALAK
ncbi:tetratricopeptide repeat protein [Acidipila sp. EB88]|uniref:tetratricopeptide repeat protein n=1 Tax=Acidipila sp. EB88 TaxID=2305226 RepID=UPI000F5DED7A|nr:tetratricopeptide repeat protein [Acidipila sp. EB88]RRA47182.1 hypothetical protein D1Y84_01650 [Acidipila sp. EB88]